MHSISRHSFSKTYKCDQFPKNKSKIYAVNPKNNVTESSLRSLEKTSHHIEYADYLRNDKVPLVVGIGPAGCGKTLISCAYAINKLINKDISKVIITRPAVSIDENHGFLPGDLESKMLPWLIPIYDCFKQYITMHRLKEMITNEDIEICPLSFIRGRTFNNSWIIADEVQNSTINQMKTLLTRVGTNSKLILTGDLEQCDLKQENGLEDFLKRHNYYLDTIYPERDSMIKITQFDEDDIMRSDIVKHVLKIYKY